MTTDDTDPRALIPMPTDFRLQVAYWRNRARRERATANGDTDPWTGLTIPELDQELIEEEQGPRPTGPAQDTTPRRRDRARTKPTPAARRYNRVEHPDPADRTTGDPRRDDEHRPLPKRGNVLELTIPELTALSARAPQCPDCGRVRMTAWQWVTGATPLWHCTFCGHDGEPLSTIPAATP